MRPEQLVGQRRKVDGCQESLPVQPDAGGASKVSLVLSHTPLSRWSARNLTFRTSLRRPCRMVGC